MIIGSKTYLLWGQNIGKITMKGEKLDQSAISQPLANCGSPLIHAKIKARTKPRTSAQSQKVVWLSHTVGTL